MASHGSFFRTICAIGAAWLLLAGQIFGSGTITGHARIERVKGVPSQGYKELYEFSLFLSPLPSTPLLIGPSARAGAPPNGEPITYDGYFKWSSLPAGTYAILLSSSLAFPRPKVVPNVPVLDGQSTVANVEPAIDYATYFTADWTGPSSVWYQTYTATGTSVTGVSFNLAGAQAAGAEVAILEDNENPDVCSWRFVGARSLSSLNNTAGDNWVRWRSNEIPTVPGRRYAVRVTGRDGGSFQPFKRNKGSGSYAGGQAYDINGQPQSFDLCYVVFADNDGLLMTMNKRSQATGDMYNGGSVTHAGQTFTAIGRGLAGVDTLIAGATWDMDLSWRIRDSGPSGPQIGPTKTTKAASYVTLGIHGVGYSPAEVDLQPGHTYFIELFSPTGMTFNPFFIDYDHYDGGIAYVGDTPFPNEDLTMTIIEYACVLDVSLPSGDHSIDRTVFQGDSLPPETINVRVCTDFSGSVDVPWLSISPINGTSNGDPVPITVSYNVASLQNGTYNGTITVVSNQAANSTQQIPVQVVVHTVRPDFDGDWDVDQRDFGHLQSCLSGMGIQQDDPVCRDADLNDDGDVDSNDLITFLECLSGPNAQAERDCEPL